MSFIQKIVDNWAIIGRPGYAGKKKRERRREINEKFGEGNWQIAHLINDKLLTREEALIPFEESYLQYFKRNPEILDWLCFTAKDIYDTDLSNINSGLDYSIQETEEVHIHDIAIRRVLDKMGCKFQGEKYLQIRGEDSEGFILSTGQVPFYDPNLILIPQIKGWWNKNSIESFWQTNKVLAVRFDKLKAITSEIVGIVLRSDISMGKGKFSTQAAHVAVTLLPERGWKWDHEHSPIEIWTIKSEEYLDSLYNKANKLKYNSCLIRDAGKTQLTPGTKTAIGIGPINQAEFDKLMSEFRATPLEAKERSYRSFQNIILMNL